jgi:transposase InsO family protein
MAIKNRPVKQNILFHSDRGVQYACADFKEQAKLSIFEYIEVWYNTKRRHSALGNKSPEQYQTFLLQNRMAA